MYGERADDASAPPSAKNTALLEPATPAPVVSALHVVRGAPHHVVDVHRHVGRFTAIPSVVIPVTSSEVDTLPEGQVPSRHALVP